MDYIKDYKKTCSIDHLEDKSVTFVKREGLMNKIIESGLDIFVILQEGISPEGYQKVLFCNDANLTFTQHHNSINKAATRKKDIISPLAKVSPYVLFEPGLKLVLFKGTLLEMKHMGNVVIEENVTIGANTIIEYATIDSTIIRRGTKIDVACLIGHNVDIGEHTAIVVGSIIGGSAKIGNHCFLGLGAVIRTHVTICDNTYIGMGSVVTKDITKKGVYCGVPAKYMREWDEKTF